MKQATKASEHTEPAPRAQLLAPGWVWTSLGEVCLVNPGTFAGPLEDDVPVSFVPMAAVEAATGRVDVSQVRPYSEVAKGYTRFSEGDVLFAKITPCMENGKIAVARGLTNGAGCGSTEFHVLRPLGDASSELAMYYLLQDDFRKKARRHMAGTAGQLRVPAWFVSEAPFPLPPLPEQHRIVSEIEKHFTRLDAAVASLQRARANLKRYRASVLKAACDGRLVPTEAELARREGRAYEPASVLLERIQNEHRASWKPGEERQWRHRELQPPNASNLPSLPEGWVWATVELVALDIVDCPHSTPVWTHRGGICVRTTEFRPGSLDLTNARYVSEETFRERTKRIRPGESDILYSREGGILGIACLVPPGVDLCLGQRMMLVRARRYVAPAFVMHVLNSPLILHHVSGLTGGSASPHLNVRDIKHFPIPLPPLAEQRRIVAEVERHMSIIHGAEAVVEANLKRAERLRQAILRRAFEGKLVPQDPGDEPASVLLERIRAEWEQAVRSTSAARRRAGRRRKAQEVSA